MEPWNPLPSPHIHFNVCEESPWLPYCDKVWYDKCMHLLRGHIDFYPHFVNASFFFSKQRSVPELLEEIRGWGKGRESAHFKIFSLWCCDTEKLHEVTYPPRRSWFFFILPLPLCFLSFAAFLESHWVKVKPSNYLKAKAWDASKPRCSTAGNLEKPMNKIRAKHQRNEKGLKQAAYQVTVHNDTYLIWGRGGGLTFLHITYVGWFCGYC